MKKQTPLEKLDDDPPSPSISNWPDKLPEKEFQEAMDELMEDEINAVGPAKHHHNNKKKK